MSKWDTILSSPSSFFELYVCVAQWLSHVQLATPWTAACQTPLSSTVSQSLLNFMSIASVMLVNHLITLPYLLLKMAPWGYYSISTGNWNSKELSNLTKMNTLRAKTLNLRHSTNHFPPVWPLLFFLPPWNWDAEMESGGGKDRQEISSFQRLSLPVAPWHLNPAHPLEVSGVLNQTRAAAQETSWRSYCISHFSCHLELVSY